MHAEAVTGDCGATAVCNTGFWTWVDLTLCIIIGCCVRVGYTLGWGRATDDGGCRGGGRIVLFVAVMGLGEPADVAE